VDDLLDLARLREARDVASLEEVDAFAVLEDVATAAREEAGRNRVVVAVDSVATTLRVRCDPTRLRLALSNLVANAVRHAPPSTPVTLRARCADAAVRFEVADSGPGVPEELRERVFERFFQVEGGRAGSSGLGLSIAREIVSGHAGRIGVDETPGGGATFWIEIPTG
jgi:two-component system OmpR family sensor kinase